MPPAPAPDAPPIHGNYLGYYKKRTGRQDKLDSDDRLATLARAGTVLPSLAGKDVLDVGCNAGNVTVEVAQRWKPRSVVGVDIDPTLVGQARQQLALAWSLQRRCSEGRSGGGTMESARGKKDADEDEEELDYFPKSMPRMFGFVPLPTPAPSPSTFPNNVTFRRGDFANEPVVVPSSVDCVFTLSIAKWIHLNNGDAGLRRFFARAHAVLRPGGCVILEPQPWSSYAKAAKLSPYLAEKQKELKLRPEADFERVLLEEVGFERVEKLAASEERGFRRALEVYWKGRDANGSRRGQEGEGEAKTVLDGADGGEEARGQEQTEKEKEDGSRRKKKRRRHGR